MPLSDIQAIVSLTAHEKNPARDTLVGRNEALLQAAGITRRVLRYCSISHFIPFTIAQYPLLRRGCQVRFSISPEHQGENPQYDKHDGYTMISDCGGHYVLPLRQNQVFAIINAPE